MSEASGTQRVDRLRWEADAEVASERDDVVIIEEPLEIRIHGVPVAVVMRTPGHDLELCRGFLRTEGIVERDADIASIRHCDTVDDPEAEDNVVQVTLSEGVDFDPQSLRRNLYASSSCGVCGKASTQAAMRVAPPLPVEADQQIPRVVLAGLPDRLREAQALFDHTGGLHAAGALTDDDRLWVREDVGRHNAVDKVVGALATRGGSPARALVVSGRVSFEIIQKALAARIPVVVAVSATTSLAIELAKRGGITLAAFARAGALSVYSHGTRVSATT